MKLKKLLLPVVLLLASFASYAQEDSSFANVYFVKSKFFLYNCLIKNIWTNICF